MDEQREIAACGCAGLTRAQLLSRAVPGNGLPAIEQGMPAPAGTGLSRRAFVSRAAGMAMAVYGANKLGWDAFEEGIASAAELPDQPILVSVFMEGGMDSLSLLAPDLSAHPRYAQLRPNLKLADGQGTPFSEDPGLRWHPSAAALATLHGEGKVSVLPAIGYTGANQSHFTSRHYWEVGETSVSARLGWMGRYLDRHGAADNPLQGLSLGWDLAPSLAAGSVPVATVSKPDEYDFWAPGVWGPPGEAMLEAIGSFGSGATSDSQLAQARGAAGAMGEIRTQMAQFDAGYGTPGGVSYPTGSDFGPRLAGLAAMLDAGLPLRCVAIQAAGGYDTHADQATSLPRNLKITCDALLAFQRDLEARGLDDRVLVQVWSEFGRRPAENGSGTDHGAGGASFVIGSRAKGTMVGEFPGLTTLDSQGNLRSTSDFRAVYKGLLEQWLGVDPAPIIPGAGSFTAPVLVS